MLNESSFVLEQRRGRARCHACSFYGIEVVYVIEVVHSIAYAWHEHSYKDMDTAVFCTKYNDR
jgi:hypothetical protein